MGARRLTTIGACQAPDSGLADAELNVIRRFTALGFRVSQMPIRKRIRCPSENRMSQVPIWRLVQSYRDRRSRSTRWLPSLSKAFVGIDLVAYLDDLADPDNAE